MATFDQIINAYQGKTHFLSGRFITASDAEYLLPVVGHKDPGYIDAAKQHATPGLLVVTLEYSIKGTLDCVNTVRECLGIVIGEKNDVTREWVELVEMESGSAIDLVKEPQSYMINKNEFGLSGIYASAVPEQDHNTVRLSIAGQDLTDTLKSFNNMHHKLWLLAGDQTRVNLSEAFYYNSIVFDMDLETSQAQAAFSAYQAAKLYQPSERIVKPEQIEAVISVFKKEDQRKVTRL